MVILSNLWQNNVFAGNIDILKIENPKSLRKTLKIFDKIKMCSNMNNDYRNLPFQGTNPETDFYTYNDIGTLLAKCEKYTDKVTNCRTIGILESEGGRFLLKEIECKEEAPQIRVAMQYMKTPLPTVQPHVVQIFGVLQWTNKPVIFARIVQVLNPAIGVRLNKTLRSIASLHLAQLKNDEQWENE